MAVASAPMQAQEIGDFLNADVQILHFNPPQMVKVGFIIFQNTIIALAPKM
jgi:hypothetical protein